MSGQKPPGRGAGPDQGKSPPPPQPAPAGRGQARGRSGPPGAMPLGPPPGQKPPGPPTGGRARAAPGMLPSQPPGQSTREMLPAAGRGVATMSSPPPGPGGRSQAGIPSMPPGGIRPMAPAELSGRGAGSSVEQMSDEMAKLGASQGGSGRGSVGRGIAKLPYIGSTLEEDQPRRVVRPPHLPQIKQAEYRPEQAQGIALKTNYFAMTTGPSWKLFQYRVDLNPEVDATAMRKALLKQQQSKLKAYLFDGTILFTPEKYVASIGNEVTHTSKCEKTGQIHQIKIKLVKELDATHTYYHQFFNIVLAQCMDSLNLERLGRSYFDSKAAKNVQQHKLKLWPGYTTSIRHHDKGVLLCAETTNKIVRNETALDVIMQHRDPKAVETAMIGTIVMTKYNNKTYRVDDIDFKNKMKSYTFEHRGNKITLQQYYNTRYGLTVKREDQPLLISRPKPQDYRRAENRGFKPPTDNVLIPEFCVMTGLTDKMRNDFRLMRDIAEYTRLPPQGRIRELQNFAKRMGSSAVKEKMAQWGMMMDSKLVEMKANTLQPEQILQGSGLSCKYSIDNADWGSEFRKWKLFRAETCQKWAVIFPSNLKNETKNFITSLTRVGPGMGFQISSAPKEIQISDDRTNSYINEINKIAPLSPALIMCVLPSPRSAEQYSAIKKVLCVKYGIPSQVVTGTVIKKEKGLMSVATKVAIQLVAKLGGEPWGIKIPLKSTMVVGFDTYHDSSQKAGSVGALVATINETLTRFHSRCIFHKDTTRAEELAKSLGHSITSAIQNYRERNNNSLPNRILFYRDGVGEGQIDHVMKHEVQELKDVFQKMGFTPKLTFIIVSKRINTRFFQVANGNCINPPSGTVVDDVVTLPERYDFFLVSQSVRQGTVAPTSYQVIHDDSGLKPEHLQMLTYKMTHMYFNWPGTVRVPSVCQYAHKCAFLVGQSVHAQPQDTLDNLLYYL